MEGYSEYVKLLYVLAEHRIQNTKRRIQNTECRVQNTEYIIHNTECRHYLHKITNIPLFYMARERNDFDADKSITWAIGRVGPWYWMIPASKPLHPAPYKQQVY